jgi:hypothetical protein
MKSSRVVIGIVVLALMTAGSLSLGQAQQQQQAPNPTGVKIGSIISAAVTTAFPAVSTILNTIWPKGKEGDKQTKPAAAAKVLDDPSVQQRKAALAQITKMGDELQTVRVFLQASTDGSEQVIAMQALLQDKTAIDDSLKSQLGQMWILASGSLSQLKDDKIQAQIDALSDDTFVQESLTQVKNVNLGRLEVVKQQIDAKQLAALRKSVDDLQSKLSGVSHLVGIVIGDISVSLKGLPSTLTPAQGAPPQYVADEFTRASKDQAAFKKNFSQQ